MKEQTAWHLEITGLEVDSRSGRGGSDEGENELTLVLRPLDLDGKCCMLSKHTFCLFLEHG